MSQNIFQTIGYMNMKKKLPRDWRNRVETNVYKHKDLLDNELYLYPHKCPLSLLSAPDEIICVTKFKAGKTPKGFKSVIGITTCEKKTGQILYTEIFDKRLRNKGLGKNMYQSILSKRGLIRTDFYECSSDARRVWKSLCKTKTHKDDFWTGTLRVWDN